MKRRKFLKATGAGIAATGLAGILAAHRAPVFAQAKRSTSCAGTIRPLRQGARVTAGMQKRSASSSTSRPSRHDIGRARRDPIGHGPDISCCHIIRTLSGAAAAERHCV